MDPWGGGGHGRWVDGGPWIAWCAVRPLVTSRSKRWTKSMPSQQWTKSKRWTKSERWTKSNGMNKCLK